MIANLTIRKKAFLIVFATLIALVATLYVLARIIVLGELSHLEDQSARLDIERVLSTLHYSLSELESTAKDWSAWDDSYEFVAGNKPEFIKANLVDLAFVHNRLNLILFLNSAGDTVYAQAYDLERQQEVPVPASLQSHIQPGSPLLSHEGLNSGVTGLLSLPEGPMLLSSQPILTSEGSGPTRGTLIFGRYLNASASKVLADATQLELMIYEISNPDLPPAITRIMPSLTSDDPVAVEPLSSDTVAAYTPVNDIYGQPSLILEVVRDRHIYSRAHQLVMYFLASLVGVGLVFGASVITLLDKAVMSRIATVRNGVRRIAATADLTSRVSLSGGDELADLASNINSMLVALQRAQSERRRAEAALAASENRFRLLVEQIPAFILTTDTDLRITSFLGGRPEVREIPQDQVLGHRLDEFPEVSEQIAPLTAALAKAVQGQSSAFQFEWNGRIDDIHVQPLHDQEGNISGAMSVSWDITDLKRLESELYRLANHDPLTGLLNSRRFQEKLEDALNQARQNGTSLALLMLDLDHFKSINDRLGHQAGDELLIDIGALMSSTLRAADSVARVGGDEFAILLPDTDIEQAERAASSILKRIREHESIVANVRVTPSASIGIAVFPQHGTTTTTLMARADFALYKAKENGRSRCTMFRLEDDDQRVSETYSHT